MESDEIAARLDNRDGYSMIDFLDVALPIYRLRCAMVISQITPLLPIEEFVLRTVDAGLIAVSEIAAFLGLGEHVVRASATTLIVQNYLSELSNELLTLTKKGRGALANFEESKPVTETLSFHFDGLVRRPVVANPGELIRPNVASKRGYKEIRPIPARPPFCGELVVQDVSGVMKETGGFESDRRSLLRIKEILRIDRWFLPALMLIFKRDGTSDGVQVGFAIDGRLSELHENAFAAAGGVRKLRIQQSIEGERKQEAHISLPAGGGRLDLDRDVERRLKRRVSVAKFKAKVAEEKAVSAIDVDIKSNALAEREKQAEIIEKAERELSELVLRPVAVYEHPELLRNALRHASEKVVIISPWITDAVVNDAFLSLLKEALRRGVNIFIGYEIGDGSQERESERRAVATLARLASENAGFRFVRFGDTHAKVLLVDSSFYVLTSFNWLSFKGDPKRGFREEFGQYVGVSSEVVKFWNDIRRRFEKSP